MPSFAKRLAELADAPTGYDGMEAERALAFAMALHPRLGAASPARSLDSELLPRHIVPPSPVWTYPRVRSTGIVDDSDDEMDELEKWRIDDFVLTTRGGTCFDSAVRYRIVFCERYCVIANGIVPRPGIAGGGPAAEWYHAPVAPGDDEIMEIVFVASSRTAATAVVQRTVRKPDRVPHGYDYAIEGGYNDTCEQIAAVDDALGIIRSSASVGPHLVVELWIDWRLRARQIHARRIARKERM